MAKSYPKQIFCLQTNKGSLDVQAEMNKVEEESNDSPLEIHRSGLSRFIVTIKENKQFVVGNIPAWDAAGIFAKSQLALEMMAQKKLSPDGPIFSEANLDKLYTKLSIGEPINKEDLDSLLVTEEEEIEVDKDSDIYTMSIPLCGGKTAAEVIQTEGINRAVNQIKYISEQAEKNSGYRERNLKQAEVLKEAVKLYNDGKLLGMYIPKDVFPIYFAGPKPRMSKKNADGDAQVYNLAINCHLKNDKYPWEVRLDNWYAKVTKSETGQLRVGQKTTAVDTKVFYISDDDWMGCIWRMEKTLDHFENMVFSEMFEMSEKYAWHPDK